ncbi:MAG: FkbM family methyltransferase, partial [Planctomycetota bacterium]|nr:FkbM family methyltransferase [Planctomycetota bacterium]
VVNDFDGDLKLRIDRASYMGSLIYWRGYHSLNELFCLRTLLKPTSVFADVGANQGEFTTFAAKYAYNGRVLSFEPLLDNFVVLKENVEINQFQNVELHQCGLGDARGSLEIYTTEDLTAHGSWHEGLGSLYRTDYRNKALGTVRIEVFDEQFAQSGCTRLDGMKIDVEGAELFVLKGAAESIQKFHPFLMLEINEETYQAAGYSKRDVVELLTGWGYRMFKIGRRGRRVEVDPSQLPDFCCTLWLPCMS